MIGLSWGITTTSLLKLRGKVDFIIGRKLLLSSHTCISNKPFQGQTFSSIHLCLSLSLWLLSGYLITIRLSSISSSWGVLCVTNASENVSCFCSRGVSFSAQFRSGAQTGPLNFCSKNTNYPAGWLFSCIFCHHFSFQLRASFWFPSRHWHTRVWSHRRPHYFPTKDLSELLIASQSKTHDQHKWTHLKSPRS